MTARATARFVGAALVIAAAAGVVRAAPCPEARRLLAAGEHARAVDAANACLHEAPGDPAIAFLLARALAYERRFVEAKVIVDRMLHAFPDDGDWRALEARLALWRGDLDGAWESVAALPPAALDDLDTARLVADIAYYREDWDGADRHYTRLLARRPHDVDALRRRGHCREVLGRREGAIGDYRTLCELEDGTCYPLHRLEREASFLTLFVQTGYLAQLRARDSWNVLSLVDVKAAEWLRVGASVDSRWRDTDREVLHDGYLEGALRVGTRGWWVRGAAGFSVRPTFSPTWTAQVEPGVAFDFGLQLRLKYWHIAYDDSHAHVLSPMAAMEVAGFGVSTRYYLSVDEARRTNHTILGKLSYWVRPDIRVHVGGGWGDRADYLSVTDLGDAAFGVAMVGLWLDFTWQHRLAIDYVLRYESASDRALLQQNLLLGYRVRF